MLATTIRSPPSVDDYVSLSQYQTQTPASFSDGKPVLHFHLPEALASVPKSQCGILALFPADTPAAEPRAATNGHEEETAELKVEVFSGVSIPYPSISIHAVRQVPAAPDGGSTCTIWMQLEFLDGGADDDGPSTMELTIVPGDAADAQKLYDAIASCSNLHPDPVDGHGDDEEEGADDDGGDYDGFVFEDSAAREAVDGFTGVLRGAADGGLPPPMPGSSGWITADNVGEYFDEEGNWIRGRDEGQGNGAGEEPGQGQGAGRTRRREEAPADGENGGGDDAENKRPRVE
ncbi:uncharacterized protein UV8b_06624 [Ustilaginoidea virens]|uniref:Benzoylformate decarboxylase n=1 Tax=Ustilaginoidea virens TaxID=1159556 RepID=A0A8E5MJ95_USTVR|nr:uncharacterized protein UV8b_06624 [Ustilaginoidea virens]QUC22383.1 hypothetical protein UV8b_06624 [Ustilaginoidea virens]